MFWHRQIKEYLPTLVDQKKWTTKCRNLEIGGLILIPVEHTARSHWPLGRIVDVYPGKYNKVHSVEMWILNGEFVRPSGRLCLFEVSCEWLEHGFVFLVEEESMLCRKISVLQIFSNNFLIGPFGIFVNLNF